MKGEKSKDDVIMWAAAALAVPYTEEAGRDIASALVQIAYRDSLRPHIPIEIWTKLKEHSTLPPPYQVPGTRITTNAVCYIRGLGDIEIFRSYLLLARSDRCHVFDVHRIGDSFREDFCGIGMWGHRQDLIKRLDKVLEDCKRGGDPVGRLFRRDEYQMLREELLEVETEATKTLIGTPCKLSLFNKYTDSATDMGVRRIPLNVQLFFASPLPMICPRAVGTPQASLVFRSSGYPIHLARTIITVFTAAWWARAIFHLQITLFS